MCAHVQAVAKAEKQAGTILQEAQDKAAKAAQEQQEKTKQAVEAAQQEVGANPALPCETLLAAVQRHQHKITRFCCQKTHAQQLGLPSCVPWRTVLHRPTFKWSEVLV